MNTATAGKKKVAVLRSLGFVKVGSLWFHNGTGYDLKGVHAGLFAAIANGILPDEMVRPLMRAKIVGLRRKNRIPAVKMPVDDGLPPPF